VAQSSLARRAGVSKNLVNPIDTSIRLLSERPCCGYTAGGVPASEPTALAALALVRYSRHDQAAQAAAWLAARQSPEGTVGVNATESSPHWPTALAILAWCVCKAQSGGPAAGVYEQQVASALGWLLRTAGKPLEAHEKLGHDPTLLGWPWVEGTHSWVEPTAWSLLALRAAGREEHPRAREAVRMLVDRLLPSGGCNYGNTTVLGQTLRPHVQPTGLALLALAGERDASGKITQSIGYLSRTISAQTTTASLSYALLALAAHDASPPRAAEWLAAAIQRTLDRGAAPLPLALGLLALAGNLR
jgi:hypothetical protein